MNQLDRLEKQIRNEKLKHGAVWLLSLTIRAGIAIGLVFLLRYIVEHPAEIGGYFGKVVAGYHKEAGK